MYFAGQLAIDPSQMTKIERIKPTKIFARFLDAITLGAASKQVELETFTAVSILQQVNMSLRSAKINNVIRLAVNEYDFYLDEKGVDDDLEQAMLQMEVKIDPFESETFDVVYLVLEHEKNDIKYLIEVSISRKHQVGEYPIQIKINGVLSEFKRKPGENRDELQKRMSDIFSDQKRYDGLLQRKNLEFNAFIDDLELAVRKFIKIDDVFKQVSKRMIRPRQKLEDPRKIKTHTQSEPLYYGYYGFNDFMWYAFMWSALCHHHDIYCHNFTMVDEAGHEVMTVGDQGFNAGESNTLNEDAPFEAPPEGDVEYHEGNDYQSELEDANLYSADADVEPEDSGESGWFGGGESNGGDSGGCSSCSSCSSCGSCGGCS